MKEGRKDQESTSEGPTTSERFFVEALGVYSKSHPHRQKHGWEKRETSEGIRDTLGGHAGGKHKEKLERPSQKRGSVKNRSMDRATSKETKARSGESVKGCRQYGSWGQKDTVMSGETGTKLERKEKEVESKEAKQPKERGLQAKPELSAKKEIGDASTKEVPTNRVCCWGKGIE